MDDLALLIKTTMDSAAGPLGPVDVPTSGRRSLSRPALLGAGVAACAVAGVAVVVAAQPGAAHRSSTVSAAHPVATLAPAASTAPMPTPAASEDKVVGGLTVTKVPAGFTFCESQPQTTVGGGMTLERIAFGSAGCAVDTPTVLINVFHGSDKVVADAVSVPAVSTTTPMVTSRIVSPTVLAVVSSAQVSQADVDAVLAGLTQG